VKAIGSDPCHVELCPVGNVPFPVDIFANTVVQFGGYLRPVHLHYYCHDSLLRMLVYELSVTEIDT
jgi:hypothetical protein